MRLFVTGGTGFVGSWLLESLAWAVTRLGVDVRVVVLTRDPDAFRRQSPALAAAPHLQLVRGDVRAVPSGLGTFDGVVHAATPASAELNRDEPLFMLDTIVDGGRSVLDLARAAGPIPFLFTSSGAVYGRAPATLESIPESYLGAPDPLLPTNAYHEGKRVGEFQCAVFADRYGIRAKIARLFAFVGPYLPLDRHLAIGNFMRDALAGRPIVVGGDGTTVRSYLYGADMVVWLWAIYARGQTSRAYNVGSSNAIDIAALARTVASRIEPQVAVEIRGRPMAGASLDRYIPDTRRIRDELGVAERIGLRDAIDRTMAFYRR